MGISALWEMSNTLKRIPYILVTLIYKYQFEWNLNNPAKYIYVFNKTITKLSNFVI